MKRSLTFILIAVVSVLAVACHKNSSGPSAGYGPNSLFPLTAGDTWYYTDSSFNDTAFAGAYKDTMVATKNTYQDPSTGTIFLGVNNPNGWFVGSYIAVDPANTAVYEVDSPAFSPYTFFQTVSQDGQVGTGSDYSNPTCVVTSVQYGYANPVSVYGYQCYRNAEVITDCHSITLEEVDTYLSPGVGVVRIVDYKTDTVGGANIFYEDYSQTLTGKSLH
ncbi:hypothetical protein [Puia dinghuensis]|uniref:Uncharacterized protein n=1 Tax=Puia dinghuensis TaxID=1792502 RepID=A0A8J2UBH8_9BACT|nr:hypothetical protein [Puia dinghuensis]GGA92316.1 hypothetical protein GCM10011511_14640 [Puia dinghuensis]